MDNVTPINVNDSCDSLTRLIPLHVNLNQETAEALDNMVKLRGITYTEAIRRAIIVYKYLLDEEDSNRKILTTNSKGKNVREIILL